MDEINVLKKHTPDQDLVQLSGFHVYTHPKNEGYLHVNKHSYYVLDVNYNKRNTSGLDAMTIQDAETGEISIIYEGTQEEKNNADILTDASLALSSKTAAQFKEAHAYYLKMKKKYKQIDHVAGNSLGGGLANYVAVKENVHSVTLDPAMLPEDMAQEIKNNKNVNITNYCGGYDPLTLAEIAGGYNDRIPGRNVPISFGISWIEFFASNHTGYIKDETTDAIKEDITIGKMGTPSYGKVRYMADANIATNIWTGEPLTSDSIGKTPRIHIDKISMTQLATATQNYVWKECQRADGYLQHSIDTVETEGIRLDDRNTTLQLQFDQLLKTNTFMNILLNIVYAEQMYLSIIKKVSPAGGLLIDVLHSPIADKITSILSYVTKLHGSLLSVPFTLMEIEQTLYDLTDCIASITKRDIPKLFEGVDNHFLDGVVEELKEHYQIVDKNKTKVMNQVANFKKQTEDIRDIFSKQDTTIGNNIAAGNSSGLASTSITPTLQVECESSPYLKKGMAIRQNQLQHNFTRFSIGVQTQLNPILNHLISLTGKIIIDLYEADGILKTLKYLADMIKIPLVTFDDKIRDMIDAAEKKVSDAIDTAEHFKTLLANLIERLPDILESFKPYIELALFNNTQYEAVMIYNLSALSILENMELQFKDICYQLSENKANAIVQICQQSKKISANMDILIEQVKRGTVLLS